MDGEEEEENDVLLSGVGKKVFWNGAAEKREKERGEAAPPVFLGQISKVVSTTSCCFSAEKKMRLVIYFSGSIKP